ncbi:MAG: hypothetical protein NTY09_01595, partial [bacterium]|nr:hypothetical protein [bacterium]
TKEEMFSDATSEEYRSWQKLERIALVIYTVIWILFMIESLIGIAIGVQIQISLVQVDYESFRRFSHMGLSEAMGRIVFVLGALVVFVGLFIERAAKLFGEKVGIDWPGRVEEALNIGPAPDITEEMFKGMPNFGPKKEELKIIENPNQDKTYILAIDPGLNKCGLAVLDSDGRIAARVWCKRNRLEDILKDLISQYKPSKIAVGDGTGSAEIVKMAEKQLPGKVKMVKERGIKYLARELSLNESTHRGFSLWLMKKLRSDLTDLSAWAAVVIGRRFIGIK